MSVDDVAVTLLDGEEAIHNENPSIAAFFAQNLPLALVTLGVLPYLYSKQSSFVVTDERIVMETGILRSDTQEFRIEDIQQISTGQSLVEKLLGCGSVQFSTPATSTDIVFHGLKDHQSIVNTIRNEMR